MARLVLVGYGYKAGKSDTPTVSFVLFPHIRREGLEMEAANYTIDRVLLQECFAFFTSVSFCVEFASLFSITKSFENTADLAD